jgi:hypothetical protein
MGKISDQMLAALLLDTRNRGYRFRDYLRRSVRGYTQFFIIDGLAAVVLAWLESIYEFPFPLTAIVISVACGALLCGIAWFGILRRQWPFREKTTDWNKVQRIADGFPSA